MFELIGLIGAGGAAALGYFQSRVFVRKRLTYVDAVQKSSAPWVAGAIAAIVAAPISWLLPLIGGGAALLFGAGVGLGVSAGAKDARRRLPAG
jgi:glutathione S-transferase